MHTFLLDISKQIYTDTGIKSNVYPNLKRTNEPQLIIKTKSLIKTILNNNPRNPDLIETLDELHVDVILDGRGDKSRFMQESFYEANETLNQYFLKRINYSFSSSQLFKCTLDLKKVVNGGVYWDVPEGTEANDIFILQELWQGVFKFYNYK